MLLFFCWQTDEWDPKDPTHKDIQYGIEIGCGISRMQPAQVARDAIKAVGFEGSLAFSS